MDSNSSKVAHDFPHFFRIYKDGRVDRFVGTDVLPASLDPEAPALSKDVLYSSDYNLSARVYLPHNTNSGQKLPVLVYFHGGGFVLRNAFSSTYHNYLNRLVPEANVITVSVDYRLAPEHPVPAAYDDSWAALKWVASHAGGNGPDEWLNRYADLGNVVLAGDSAGANIAHRMGMRFGEERLNGINLAGIILVHPYFWGKEPVGDEMKPKEMREKIEAMWVMSCPTSSGSDDPLINPCMDPKLGGLGCRRVLVIVAEKDLFKSRGWNYYEKLKESGWEGEVEIMEAKGENHVFHLFNGSCDNAMAMLKKITSFMYNQEKA